MKAYKVVVTDKQRKSWSANAVPKDPNRKVRYFKDGRRITYPSKPGDLFRENMPYLFIFSELGAAEDFITGLLPTYQDRQDWEYVEIWEVDAINLRNLDYCVGYWGTKIYSSLVMKECIKKYKI